MHYSPLTTISFLKNNLTYLALVVFTFSFAKCGNQNCAQTTYELSAAMKVTPEKSTFNIGDTIWLEMNQPVQMIDNFSQKTIDFYGAQNFGTVLYFLGFNESESFPAAENFEFILPIGSFVGEIRERRFQEFLFIESSGYYKFRLGMVVKKLGYFYFVFSDSENTFTNKNMCEKARVKLQLTNSNKNLDLLDRVNPEMYIPYKSTSLFAFQVK